MKRLIICFVFLLSGTFAMAQTPAEEDEIKEVVNTFFEGFHARDSIIMKSVVNDGLLMQSVAKDPQGKTILNTQDFSKFLKSIVSIPATTNFKEQLHSYNIEIDGEMAKAWTPYSLYVNDVLQHCGVNYFQLYKINGEWKIIYLIDTRRREGCDEKEMK